MFSNHSGSILSAPHPPQCLTGHNGKHMKRFLLLVFFLAAAGSVSAQDLTVGVILPFSTAEGAAFEQVLSGMQRNVRLHSSPALGDLTVLERDDRGSPERAAELALELLTEQDVHALVCCRDSRTAAAVAEAVAAEHVPVLSLAGAGSLEAGSTVLALEADVLGSMRALTSAARQHDGGISLLTTDDATGEAAEQAFRDGALEAGLPVLRVVQFRAGASPLTPEALLAATSQAAVIVVWADEADTQEAVRALAARGWDGPVLVRHEWAASLTTRAGPLQLGTVVPPALLSGTTSAPEANRPALTAWRSAAGAVLSGERAGLGSARLYDALSLLLAAHEQAFVYSAGRELNTGQLRSALYDGLAGAGTIPSAAGTYRLSPRSWSLALPEGLLPATVRGGRFIPGAP